MEPDGLYAKLQAAIVAEMRKDFDEKFFTAVNSACFADDEPNPYAEAFNAAVGLTGPVGAPGPIGQPGVAGPDAAPGIFEIDPDDYEDDTAAQFEAAQKVQSTWSASAVGPIEPAVTVLNGHPYSVDATVIMPRETFNLLRKLKLAVGEAELHAALRVALERLAPQPAAPPRSGIYAISQPRVLTLV